MLNGYFEERERLKDLPILLNGNEIMDILGIKQGKELGEIIKKLHNAQVEKKVNTKEQAIKYIKDIIL